MATHSQPPSQTCSPVNQGDMGPFLLSATAVEIREVSLKRITCLLLGLLGQVECLEQEVVEIKEAGIKTCTNNENISQTVDVVKDGLRSLQSHGPKTPEDTKPLVVEATPCPLSKANPVGLTSWVSFWPCPGHGHMTSTSGCMLAQAQIWGVAVVKLVQFRLVLFSSVYDRPESSRELPAFAQPTPVQAVPLQVPSPPVSLRLQSPIRAPTPAPPAPVAAYPALVKVDHPDAYTGKIGSEAKQWLTRMLAWTQLNSRMFLSNQEVLSFLLMNMKDAARAWAHPHLDQLGSHQAIIQMVEGFKLEFLAAFGNPDATRATKRKNAALVIDNALCKECASHPPRDNKSSKQSNPARETSTSQSTTSSKKLSNNPNFLLEEERNCCCAAGACIKCSKMGHKFAECCMGWRATPIKDKGKAKETAKIGKDSEYQLGKE
ncbi:hypothetical protein RhiTH_010504 [Rhizoctonia solani]